MNKWELSVPIYLCIVLFINKGNNMTDGKTQITFFYNTMKIGPERLYQIRIYRMVDYRIESISTFIHDVNGDITMMKNISQHIKARTGITINVLKPKRNKINVMEYEIEFFDTRECRLFRIL